MTHPPGTASSTDPTDPTDTDTTGAPGSVVAIRDGAVAIDGRPILREISLEIARGEFVALLGANGSGKSTLVRALLGLRPLTQGTLSLFGTPWEDFSDWSRIGYVPQHAQAATGVPVSVREVVASGRLTRRRLLRPLGREDREAIDSALETVGLSDRAQASVSTLSGGQQQRVLIARALAGRPDLLVLDEPTAGVDLHNQQLLADTLGRLRSSRVSVLLVAHELGSMLPLVTRSVVMTEGRIGYDGVPLEAHGVAPLTGGTLR